MKTIAFMILAFVVSFHAKSEVLEVEYASFYSHVKKLDNEETNLLRFAFGFLHVIEQRLCHITEAKIVTEKKELPLLVEHHQRFTVPIDKVLKMAKARIVIGMDDQANQCDMSVQLETLPSFLKNSYTHAELSELLTQYQVFFDNMGGFLSFLMPSARGLVIQFSESFTLPEQLLPLKDDKGNIRLDSEWFKREQGIELNGIPLRVTALIDK